MMMPIIGGYGAVSGAFAPSIIAKAEDRNDRECRECDDNYDGFHIGNLTVSRRLGWQPVLLLGSKVFITHFRFRLRSSWMPPI
jgi:hypothetical protein